MAIYLEGVRIDPRRAVPHNNMAVIYFKKGDYEQALIHARKAEEENKKGGVWMTDQAAIDDFLAEKKLAVVGVSHDKNKFGNIVFRRLRAHGFEVFAVNPKINVIEGNPCFPNLAALPEPVGGVVIVVPPEATKQVVIDAAASGIKRVWMQPGAESDEAVRFCEEHGMEVIYGLCIMTLSGS